MLEKTRGIVLHQIKYSDSSVIIHCYTEKFGRRSLMISGVHSRKSSAKAALFQPLSLLEMEIYFREKRDIHRIKEARTTIPFTSLPFDIVRSSMALFVAELLYKTLKEEKGEPELFEFLYSSVHFLDAAEDGVANFHLIFMAHYIRFMGFYPDMNSYVPGAWFDMRTASFNLKKPLHRDVFPPDHTKIFTHLLTLPVSRMAELSLSTKLRNALLEDMIKFYQAQQEGITDFKTYPILREIFS